MDNREITTWSEMKAVMKKWFKPQDYKQRAHIQLNQLKQGPLTMEEYTNKFQHLATQVGFKWNDEILVTMYQQGLHLQISLGLYYHYYSSVDDAIQITYQIEDNIKSLSYKKPFIENASKSMIVGSGSSISRTANKPLFSDVTSAPSRSTRPFSPFNSHDVGHQLEWS